MEKANRWKGKSIGMPKKGVSSSAHLHKQLMNEPELI